MNEAVLGTVFGRDETKALVVVEPLHCAGRTHAITPVLFCCGRSPVCRTCRLQRVVILTLTVGSADSSADLRQLRTTSGMKKGTARETRQALVSIMSAFLFIRLRVSPELIIVVLGAAHKRKGQLLRGAHGNPSSE